MRRIGLISDTHSSLPSGLPLFFENVDEIWHAGDIGNQGVVDALQAMKPMRAVYGNIDGAEIRSQFPEYLVFDIEKVRVLIIHIGGSPPKYNRDSLALIKREKPQLFICGHSHILKVIYDKTNSLLHINPGSAGKYGWHKAITYLRFIIDEEKISDLEIGQVDRK
ncbi:MAG: metallophosphoesterase family protein [Bacteroidetes bacterium]|nr:metallophosphoesterase family protein [Bacteroidota bacterium]